MPETFKFSPKVLAGLPRSSSSALVLRNVGKRLAALATLPLPIALTAATFLLPALSRAQTSSTPLREFVGGRFTAPPTLDGKVEEAEYKDAVRFEGLVDVDTGGQAPEGGRFYLGYDAKFVYFAAVLVDKQPSSIQATEFRTNVSLEGNDTVGLTLDPFGKLSDFSTFTMNARGATNLDIAGGRAAKREWLGDFAAKGRVTATGWEVEARIPWSVLRLPGKGAHDLRFNVFRNLRRLQKQYAWAQTSNGLVQNYGRWKAVDLPAAQTPMLMALPYVYGGLDSKKGVVANSGVDLRYPITPELDLVGTVNPDFRNVERGVLSLDFSYFERLADETRPFFLEGAGYFGPYDAGGIFTSQRIGNFDAGVKSFGKLDPATSVGVLATEDFGNRDATVARVQRQLDPRTDWTAQYAGGGDAGRRNDAFAAQFNKGVGGWEFRESIATTTDADEGTGHKATLSAEYSHDRSYANLRYGEVTDNYLPRLGYAPETNLRGFTSYLSQHWAAPKRGFVDYGVEGYLADQRSYGLDKPFHEEAGFFPNMTLKSGLTLGLNLDWSRYFGGSSDQTYGFFVQRPAGDPYRHWSVSYESGTRADQPYHNLSLGVAYRPLPTFQLNGSLQRTTYQGTTMTQEILSANYDLDEYHSVGGRTIQGPGVSNFYVSFRQAGNRGTEYYLILGDPNAAHFRASLILKAVFPLSFKV